MNAAAKRGGGAVFEQAKANALKAFEYMTEFRIPPTPANFATWYTYAAGSDPNLTTEIDRIRKEKVPLDGTVMARLHHQFLADGKEREGLANISERIEQAMKALVDNLGQAEAGAQAYGETLSNLSGELSAHEDGNSDANALQHLIATVVTETNRMAALNRQLEERLNSSAAEITQLRKDLDTVKVEAATDGLTGIPNRKAFDRALEDSMREARQKRSFLSLLILDIDHFKKFNDTHGHQTGDLVLKLVARTMVDVVGDNGLPARLGGEEFGVLLPDHGLMPARKLADKLRTTVGSKVLRNRRTGTELGSITLSIGVSEWVIGEPAESLIERADEALYLAKRSGRNQVRTQLELDVEQEEASA